MNLFADDALISILRPVKRLCDHRTVTRPHSSIYTSHNLEQNSDGEVLSTHTNVLVLYSHLCAWILNRLCTARSVYVGQSYTKCGYKSTKYTYKLLICTAKMSWEDETKCVELTALEKNNESKEINQWT